MDFWWGAHPSRAPPSSTSATPKTSTPEHREAVPPPLEPLARMLMLQHAQRRHTAGTQLTAVDVCER